MLGVVVLIALVSASESLRVTVPEGEDKWIDSPTFNYRIGLQNSISHPNITGLYIPQSHTECCESPANAYNGMVVGLLTENMLVAEAVSSTQKAVFCAEERGAIAVVRTLGNAKVPGAMFYFNDGKLKPNTIGIPVVNTVGGKLKQADARARSHGDVTVAISVDESEWIEMWESTLLMLCWYYVIPPLNMIAAGFAFRGAYLRIRTILQPIGRVAAQTDPVSNKIMALGCCFEIMSAACRVAWCFIGPMFSSGDITVIGHFLLLCIPVCLASCSNVLAVSLFLRWGAFKNVLRTEDLTIHRWLYTLAVGLFILPFVVASVTNENALSISSMAGTLTMTLVVTVVTASMFLYHGGHIANRLANGAAAKGTGTKRSSSRRLATVRAVRWIMTSSLFQMVTTGCILALVLGVYFYPNPTLMTFSVMFIAQTLGSTATAEAFTPMRRSNRHRNSSLATNDNSRSYTNNNQNGGGSVKVLASTRSLINSTKAMSFKVKNFIRSGSSTPMTDRRSTKAAKNSIAMDAGARWASSTHRIDAGVDIEAVVEPQDSPHASRTSLDISTVDEMTPKGRPCGQMTSDMV